MKLFSLIHNNIHKIGDLPFLFFAGFVVGATFGPWAVIVTGPIAGYAAAMKYKHDQEMAAEMLKAVMAHRMFRE